MNLLTVTAAQRLSPADLDALRDYVAPLAEKLDAQVLVVDSGLAVQYAQDLGPLVAALQAQTAAIESLVALVAAQIPDEPHEEPLQPMSRKR